MTLSKVTAADLRSMKARGIKIASLTTYDYPMTRLLDEADVPFLLVGDSLGMVVLGYPDAISVAMEEMEHHVRAAARAKPRALLGADLPYHTYQTPQEAVRNARRLVAAGAEVVKAEGGRTIMGQVEAILREGIPFIAHLGMLPQNVRAEGGYKIKGKNEEEREALLADALALDNAGASAIVLELVTPPVAEEISRRIKAPTIGIGSGPHCDGQILVTPDLIGKFPWFTPKFVKPKVSTAAQVRTAVEEWKREIQQQQ